MVTRTSPKRWYELSLEFLENVHKTKPWINIDHFAYKGTKLDVHYVCTRHDFYGAKSGAALLKGKGCKRCEVEDSIFRDNEYQRSRREKEFKVFLQKAEKLHGDAYDYSSSKYICSRTKMSILCNTHKEYFEQRPSAHIQGQGCPKCGEEATANKNRHSIEGLIEIFDKCNKNPLVSLPTQEYFGIFNNVVLVCSKHGEFSVEAGRAIRESEPCLQCNKDRRILEEVKDFIRKGKTLFGNRFGYDRVVRDYKNNRSKVELFCKTHKTYFRVSKNYHTRDGSFGGCIECARVLWGRWSPDVLMKDYEHYSKEKCSLYIVKLTNNCDSFYKVGISTNLDRRFSQLVAETGFEVDIVYVHPSNTYACSVVEYKIRDNFSNNNFKNNVKFGGYTECYSFDEEELQCVIETAKGVFDKGTNEKS